VSFPQPTVSKTTIPGLLKVDVVVNAGGDDPRGTFRESWQAEKMEAAGLPKFVPVQMNVAESTYGVIRGIHAEPWEKYIHLASGTGFAAIVDLRKDSPAFGRAASFELNDSVALYVPRGLGNSYAVTSERAAYTYLVNEHWRPDAKYPAVAYDDPDLGIEWPVPEPERIVSEKDRRNPSFAEFKKALDG
jgi:dTDP-4-dehydrorhamnose 3,5-epimerase